MTKDIRGSAYFNQLLRRKIVGTKYKRVKVYAVTTFKRFFLKINQASYCLYRYTVNNFYWLYLGIFYYVK